jgi:hypothetical protein
VDPTRPGDPSTLPLAINLTATGSETSRVRSASISSRGRAARKSRGSRHARPSGEGRSEVRILTTFSLLTALAAREALVAQEPRSFERDGPFRD